MTKDPELRQTQNGKSVCNFTVAVNRRKSSQNQNGQNNQPDADFFRIAAWGEMGEACAKYLAKGRKVCVIGAVQVRTYKDNNGEFRASLEVPFAQDVEFLSSKADGNNAGGQTATEAPAEPQADGFTQTNTDELPF